MVGARVCCRTVHRQADSIVRGHQAVQVRVVSRRPSLGWEDGAPPVEMETDELIIIIIIQCLWAAVGSPSKREDDVGAHALGPR